MERISKGVKIKFLTTTFSLILLFAISLNIVLAQEDPQPPTEPPAPVQSSEPVEPTESTEPKESDASAEPEPEPVDSVDVPKPEEPPVPTSTDFETQKTIQEVIEDVSSAFSLQVNMYPYGEITNPATDNEEFSNPITLTAEYYDDDPDVDAVNWAVRLGTCAANTGTVFGNVDGHTDSYEWDGTFFSAVFDSAQYEPGDYCFVFNPTDDGNVDVREERWFTIPEPDPVTPNACDAGTIFGVNQSSDLIEVDPTTGEFDVIAELEFGSWAVTVDPDTGFVYYLSTNGNSLGEYDPVTGDSDSFPVTGASIGNVSRLAFHPLDGVMYAGDQDLKLFTLTTGGEAILLGTISGIAVGGGDIAFSPDGTLYVIGHDGILYTVNIGTLVATEVAQTGLSRPSGLAWGDDGLYVSNMSDNDTKVQLYFIDVEDATNPTVEGSVNDVRNQDLGSCIEYKAPDDDGDNDDNVVYGNYCGDGYVNQEWEQCDAGLEGGESCTVQCQTPNQCTESAFARVMTVRALNEDGGNGNMTSDVFVGQGTTPIPAGAWFPVYLNGEWIVDVDVNGSEGYEDVPGYAIERQNGQVRLVVHGGNGSGDGEFAEGYLEFWNITANDQVADTEGDNVLENPFNGTHAEPFGFNDDELDLEEGLSKFIFKVSSGDDGFYTVLGDAPICVPGPEDSSTSTPDIITPNNATDTSGSTGSRRRTVSSGAGEVLGASTVGGTCQVYLNTYMRQGVGNDPAEVTKLQTFLNGQGISVPVTGVFGPLTAQAVGVFQVMHAGEVLMPWVPFGLGDGVTPTGYVFKTTRWKINNIVCPGSEAYPLLP